MKRIIGLIFTALLLATNIFAQEMPVAKNQFYTLENFSEMLKSHISDYLIKDGAAVQAINVKPNEKYGSLSKREKRLELGSCHLAPIKSLYRFYKSDDTKYTISTSSTYIDAIDNSGVCTNLYASASDSKHWSWITYKDIAIGMNGTNNAKKWDGSLLATDNTDGHRTSGDLVSDLGAPFAELNTGANLDASSWYQYKVAYYNGSTYTYSSARSNPILTGASVRDIKLTDIPLGPEGTTTRYIYRTEGQASRAAVVASTTFKKVATISNNIDTELEDTMDDATWNGDAVPTWTTVSTGTDVTPPKSKYSLINKERLFIANDPSGTAYGKSTIYWSKSFRPDYFDYNTDYELIRPDDGDEITFIKNLLGTLTIGKTRTINKLYTEIINSTFTVTPSDPFSFIGCVAPFSAVNGINGIIYLGRYGIYRFNGQSSTLISDVITDKVRDILETSVDDVYATYYDNSYLMAYTSKETGVSINDKVLIFNITRDSYYEETGNIGVFALYDSSDDAGTLFSGSSDTDGTIWAHGDSFNNLIYRYKSALEGGTYSTIYAASTYGTIYIGGTENSPIMTLGGNSTWDMEGTTTWNDSGATTWIMESLTGEWYSPVVQINATSLDKLYWNESLGSYGDVSFALRTGSTASACSIAAWSSSLSSPSGSDVSGITADDFIQLRASLSSSVYTESPALYLEDSFVIKLIYKKSGDTAESSFLSLWQGGMTGLGNEHPKRIKEIQVFYEGTEGTMRIYFDNSEGISRYFDIDLSVNPADSATDSYFGTNEKKIFTYIIPFNISAVGRQFQFKVVEDGTEQWKVNRIVVRFDSNPYVTFGGGL